MVLGLLSIDCVFICHGVLHRVPMKQTVLPGVRKHNDEDLDLWGNRSIFYILMYSSLLRTLKMLGVGGLVNACKRLLCLPGPHVNVFFTEWQWVITQNSMYCGWSINARNMTIIMISLFVQIDHLWFIQLYVHSDTKWKEVHTSNHSARRVDLNESGIEQWEQKGRVPLSLWVHSWAPMAMQYCQVLAPSLCPPHIALSLCKHLSTCVSTCDLARDETSFWLVFPYKLLLSKYHLLSYGVLGEAYPGLARWRIVWFSHSTW